MQAEDLHCLYRQLRIQLEAAYAARPLDPALIDRIAQDMLPLEAELAAQGTATLDRFVTRAAAASNASGSQPQPEFLGADSPSQDIGMGFTADPKPGTNLEDDKNQSGGQASAG